jgi:ribonuclease J
MIFVDGVDIGDVADVALRDRRMLSADGIFVVVATISEQDGSSVADPEIILRGVPFPDEAEQLLDEIRSTVEASLARAATEEIREIDLLQTILHDDLAALVYERLRRRPMVLPVVVEV